jgi:glucose dehydrogenase
MGKSMLGGSLSPQHGVSSGCRYRALIVAIWSINSCFGLHFQLQTQWGGSPRMALIVTVGVILIAPVISKQTVLCNLPSSALLATTLQQHRLLWVIQPQSISNTAQSISVPMFSQIYFCTPRKACRLC